MRTPGKQMQYVCSKMAANKGNKALAMGWGNLPSKTVVRINGELYKALSTVPSTLEMSIAHVYCYYY